MNADDFLEKRFVIRLFLSLWFCFLFVLTSSAQSAKPLKINFRNIGLAKISVAKGKAHSTIDLSKDVAGCAYVAGKSKRELDISGCASPPATFKLIESTVKNNQTFLVIESDAMDNCNVCGRCGAADSYSLIWLKLDSRLRVVNKHSVPIDDCLSNISSRQVKQHENDNLSDLRLVFRKNILTVEFEKAIYNDSSDVSGYEFSRLEYNRKMPETGFVIKTEKRKKSSIE